MDSSSGDRVQSPEQLVTAFRDAREVQEFDRADEALGRILGSVDETGMIRGGFCEGAIRRTAQKWGISGEELPDFRSACYLKIVEALRGPRARKWLWEEAFSVALFGIVTDVRRQWVRRREREAREVDLDLVDQGAMTEASVDPHDRLEIQEILSALSQLNEPMRNAAYLHWIKELKIESRDPQEATVATVLGVSGRSVRTYLRQARESIKHSLSGQAIAEETYDE